MQYGRNLAIGGCPIILRTSATECGWQNKLINNQRIFYLNSSSQGIHEKFTEFVAICAQRNRQWLWSKIVP